jgi:hypothetical protein
MAFRQPENELDHREAQQERLQPELEDAAMERAHETYHSSQRSVDAQHRHQHARGHTCCDHAIPHDAHDRFGNAHCLHRNAARGIVLTHSLAGHGRRTRHSIRRLPGGISHGQVARVSTAAAEERREYHG